MKKYDMLTNNKLTLMAFCVVAFATLFSGCWWKSKTAETQDSGDSKLVVINVLDKDYYDDCHITGSINVPFDTIETHMGDLSKDNQYVIYCSNYACTAAPFSAKTMKDAGFENVMVYHGGIVEWHQKGYPCSGPAQKPYLEESSEPLGDHDDEEVSITAEALLEKMKEANLL